MRNILLFVGLLFLTACIPSLDATNATLTQVNANAYTLTFIAPFQGDFDVEFVGNLTSYPDTCVPFEGTSVVQCNGYSLGANEALTLNVQGSEIGCVVYPAEASAVSYACRVN